jgi:cytochrome c553
MRNIAPCGACHGELGSKIGAPWLEGQPVTYLHAQLDAFANGTRRSDIDQQMRNVARGMTPDEITAASR